MDLLLIAEKNDAQISWNKCYTDKFLVAINTDNYWNP